MKKAVQRHVDHALPLTRPHARKDGVVVNAGVVHEHLDWPAGEHGFQSAGGGGAIGHVEG